MRIFAISLFTCWLLAGCFIFDDPGGFTTRAQIRSDAQVAQEHERTLARMAEAQAKVDQEAAKQAGANHRAATWAMILPVALLFAGATVVGCIVVNWRGRIAYERTRQQAIGLDRPAYIPASQQLVRTEYQILKDCARQYGAELQFIHGKAMLQLPDGRKLLIKREELS